MQNTSHQFLRFICAGLTVWLTVFSVFAAESLQWNKTNDTVTADVRGIGLTELLERVATETGWQVFVEPGTKHQPSAKFKDLASGDALQRLLGTLNFALVPQTNVPSRLYVFATAINNATQQIAPTKRKAGPSKPKRVPNELIVRLKPGENIDEIAKALGAKVIGKIPELNAYRLQFDDAIATTDAYADLQNNAAVDGVDFNYYLDRPDPAQGVISSTGLPGQLTLKPSSDSSGLVVGIVDTGVQSLGSDLDKLITKRFSVAGDSSLDNSTPAHGTTMFESILQGIQASGNGTTSAQFISVDVFGNNASTTTFDVATGIATAYNNGATWINVSLGGSGTSPVLQNIIQTLVDRGVAIFAAAGNEPTGQPVYPAAYAGVTAVTAVNKGQVASYANMAGFVDVGAPGSAIVYFNNTPYFVQGTSVSTAFTTGAAVGMAQKTGGSWTDIQPIIYKSLAVPATK
jgi:thermitase